MPERQLRFPHTEPGAGGVDRHAHFAAEAGSHREAPRPRRGRERPLAGEGFAWLEAGERADQAACDALRDAEATAEALGERGDVEVDALLEQRRKLAGQIRVAEQERSRRCCPLGRRQRLALAATRQTQHHRARVLREVSRPVSRAVVRDDHLRIRKPSA